MTIWLEFKKVINITKPEACDLENGLPDTIKHIAIMEWEKAVSGALRKLRQVEITPLDKNGDTITCEVTVSPKTDNLPIEWKQTK